MQVFNISGGERVLIGRVDRATKEVDPATLVLEGWLPLSPVQNTPQIPVGDQGVQQLKTILAMLVERNGGAVHVSAGDLFLRRPLSIVQTQDPWGIILTTEAE